MSAVAERVQARSDRAGAWLYGRWTDLFFGCGLSYLLSLPLLYAVGQWTSTSSWPNSYVVLFALLINSPHYGATILRVYESGADRKKYAVFALYITLAIAVLFVASSRSVLLASVLITAYLTWSPWHFSGQNYGLALMFLRRRGIDVDPLTKRLVYGSFVLSAALAILAIHGGHESLVFAPNTIRVAHAPQILALKPPASLAGPLRVALFVAYGACLGVAGWRLSRHARLRDLVPAGLLVLTQASWFTIPALVGRAAGTLMFSAIWISVWHSLQYLWVTTYYARSSESHASVQRFLLKALVAGTAIQALPGVAMSPQWLGRVPWDAGLAATLFAVVNLHHFVLDGAIWKLRDGRVARVLLRSPDPIGSVPSPLPPRHRPWARALVWTIASLGLLVPLGQAFGRSALEGPPQQGELQRSLQVLRWVGRETTKMHYRIGTLYAREGNHSEAISHFQRSIELFPTAYVWFALGTEYVAVNRWEPARAAFEAAIELEPAVPEAHFWRAQALLARSDAASGEEAAASLERALELRPGYSRAALALARIYAQDGQKERALRTLERTLAAAEPEGAEAVRDALARLRS